MTPAMPVEHGAAADMTEHDFPPSQLCLLFI